MSSQARWLVGSLVALGCATPVAHAPAYDAGPRDAPPPDAWEVIAHPPIRAGGGDAGHDAGRSGACVARLLVVFDRSLSMQEPWTSGSTTAPRWQVAETTLAEAVSPSASRLEIGAILFPSSDVVPMPTMTCAPVDPIERQIPFEDGADFLSTWSSTWRSPVLYGSTPIDAAFDAADAALAGAGAETAVVLLTDGEPTCTGAPGAAARAASWHGRGIATWVVGLPGSSVAVDYLTSIAAAGGTHTPLSAEDPAALGTALGGIASGQVQSACGP